MTLPERKEIKGHTLKRIYLRLDYLDLIKVPDEAVKAIKQLCIDYNLDKTTVRTLQPSDFEVSEFEDELNLPYEFIKEIKSRVFLNEDQSMNLEVNQFFIQLTQNVISNDKYIGFTQMKNLFVGVCSKLEENEEMMIARKLSVQKVNEIYYNDIKNLANDFNINYLGLDAYNEFIDWLHPLSRLEKKNSFAINNSLMEIFTVLDNGQIEEDQPPMIRLILRFENFISDKFPKIPLDRIDELNNDIYKVFFKGFTPQGQEKISKGERLGDYNEKV